MADINNNLENHTRPDYAYDSAIHTRRVTSDEVAQRNEEIAQRQRYLEDRNVEDRNVEDRIDENARRRYARQNAREAARVERVSTLIRQEEDPIERERTSTAIGLMLGVLVTTVIGLLLAMSYFAARRDNTVVTPQPVPTTQSRQVPPQATTPAQPQQSRTTIIERTRETVPAPQQRQIIVPAPSPSSSTTTVPAPSTSNTAPATTSQPAPANSTTNQTQGTTQGTQPQGTAPTQGTQTQPQNNQAQPQTQPQNNQPQNNQPQNNQNQTVPSPNSQTQTAPQSQSNQPNSAQPSNNNSPAAVNSYQIEFPQQ